MASKYLVCHRSNLLGHFEGPVVGFVGSPVLWIWNYTYLVLTGLLQWLFALYCSPCKRCCLLLSRMTLRMPSLHASTRTSQVSFGAQPSIGLLCTLMVSMGEGFQWKVQFYALSLPDISSMVFVISSCRATSESGLWNSCSSFSGYGSWWSSSSGNAGHSQLGLGTSHGILLQLANSSWFYQNQTQMKFKIKKLIQKSRLTSSLDLR